MNSSTLMITRFKWFSALLMALLLNACGGSSTPEYTISTFAGGGGTITPWTATVKQGGSQTFTLRVNAGHYLESVTGCNGVLTGNQYQVSNVTSDCRVVTEFVRESIRTDVQLEVSENGRYYLLQPTLSVEIENPKYNDRQTFVVSLPDQNWSLESFTGCPIDDIEGGDQLAPEYKITTAPLIESCTFFASVLAPEPGAEHTITAEVFNASVEIPEATFQYGDVVRLNFISPNPLRELLSLTINYANGYCSVLQESSAFVEFVVQGNCHLEAMFLGEDEHQFASPYLMQAFRESLELAPEQLMLTSDVARATVVSVQSNEHVINDFAGIEAAVALEALDVTIFNRTNLLPLSQLPIKDLSIQFRNRSSWARSHYINDLTGLPLRRLSLTNWSVLEASQRSAQYDILASFTDLNWLELGGYFIDQLDFALDLPHLHTLVLNSSTVHDIWPILRSSIPSQGELGAFHFTNGCAHANQAATQKVMAELESYGVHVSVGSTPRAFGCPRADNYYQAEISAELNGSTLTIDYDSTANYAANCHIYLNLYAQQPRIEDLVFPDCAPTGTLEFEVTKEIQSVEMSFDDGLFSELVSLGRVAVKSNNSRQEATLAVVDWGQVMFKKNPYLVPGRAALLRAHVISSNSAVSPPSLTAMLYHEGHSEELTFKRPASLPATPVYGNLNGNYNVIVPATWMQEGLRIDILQNGKVIHSQTPNFAEPTTLYLSVFNLIIDGQPANVPSDELIKEAILTHWPIGDVVIEHRELEISQETKDLDPRELLFVLRSFHAREGAQNFYHGFFDRAALNIASPILGIAFQPGLIGVTYDHPDGFRRTLAHELGHNFSLGHVPCGGVGNTGVITEYPYPSNELGSYGINYALDQVIDPRTRADLMGYCPPGFISDYVYEIAQDYLSRVPPLPFSASYPTDLYSAQQPAYSTYISGYIDQLHNKTRLLSHFELAGQPAGRETYGRFRVIATDAQGRKYERRFAISQTSESTSESNGFFDVRIPAVDIVHVTIRYDDKVIFSERLNTH